jgi:uroporphyrinogen-III synthase
MNRIPESSLAAVAALFANADSFPDAITFTSASTARNLAALLEASGLALPITVTRASIGPITSQALRKLGMPADLEAAESTISSLVAGLGRHFNKGGG